VRIIILDCGLTEESKWDVSLSNFSEM